MPQVSVSPDDSTCIYTRCSKKTKPLHYLSHLCQTTPSTSGGKFNDSFVATFLPSLSGKEFENLSDAEQDVRDGQTNLAKIFYC